MNSSLLRRGRLRWLKFTLVGLVVALVFTAGVGLLVRTIFIYDAETQYQKLTAELDQSDPYWRWDEIQAHLAVIPPEENSARIIASVCSLLPLDVGWIHRESRQKTLKRNSRRCLRKSDPPWSKGWRKWSRIVSFR